MIVTTDPLLALSTLAALTILWTLAELTCRAIRHWSTR